MEVVLPLRPPRDHGGLLRRATVVVIAVAVAGCGGGHRPVAHAAPAPRLTPAVARELDARFAAKVADAGIPGAAASIVFADGRQWSAAAGAAVLHPRRAMTTRTVLPFDSVTKVAVAALVLRLTEAGRLRLDDPVRRWYPAWRGDRAATVRELLAHRAGTRDAGTRAFRRLLDGRRRPRPADVIAAAPRPGAPTATPEYSNTGFLILGEVARRAGGAPVARLLRREVLDHPGGEGLAFQPAERPHGPLGHTYWYPHGLDDPVDVHDGGPYVPNRRWVDVVGTAGALAGDVPSLARWAHGLFTGAVLRRRSLREMTAFTMTGASGYGLGLARETTRDQRPVWGHVGDGWGSHTELWHLPAARLTIAVTWNDDVLEDEGGIVEALVDAAAPQD